LPLALSVPISRAYTWLMPKKSRRAHVPNQAAKRKGRRPGPAPAASAPLAEEPTFAEPPVAEVPGYTANVVGTRPLRRLEQLRASREQTAVRVVPGQLPTYERAYLVGELRRIALTAGSLFALLIVLTILLR